MWLLLVWHPPPCPPPPATSTGDLACNPGMCSDRELNRQPFRSQAGTQSTEPHQPGLSDVLSKIQTLSPVFFKAPALAWAQHLLVIEGSILPCLLLRALPGEVSESDRGADRMGGTWSWGSRYCALFLGKQIEWSGWGRSFALLPTLS